MHRSITRLAVTLVMVSLFGLVLGTAVYLAEPWFRYSFTVYAGIGVAAGFLAVGWRTGPTIRALRVLNRTASKAEIARMRTRTQIGVAIVWGLLIALRPLTESSRPFLLSAVVFLGALLIGITLRYALFTVRHLEAVILPAGQRIGQG